MLKQWLELQEVSGTKAAFEALANSQDAEEFARVGDEAQQDQSKGTPADGKSSSST